MFAAHMTANTTIAFELALNVVLTALAANARAAMIHGGTRRCRPAVAALWRGSLPRTPDTLPAREPGGSLGAACSDAPNRGQPRRRL